MLFFVRIGRRYEVNGGRGGVTKIFFLFETKACFIPVSRARILLWRYHMQAIYNLAYNNACNRRNSAIFNCLTRHRSVIVFIASERRTKLAYFVTAHAQNLLARGFHWRNFYRISAPATTIASALFARMPVTPSTVPRTGILPLASLMPHLPMRSGLSFDACGLRNQACHVRSTDSQLKL